MYMPVRGMGQLCTCKGDAELWAHMQAAPTATEHSDHKCVVLTAVSSWLSNSAILLTCSPRSEWPPRGTRQSAMCSTLAWCRRSCVADVSCILHSHEQHHGCSLAYHPPPPSSLQQVARRHRLPWHACRTGQSCARMHLQAYTLRGRAACLRNKGFRGAQKECHVASHACWHRSNCLLGACMRACCADGYLQPQ